MLLDKTRNLATVLRNDSTSDVCALRTLATLNIEINAFKRLKCRHPFYFFLGGDQIQNSLTLYYLHCITKQRHVLAASVTKKRYKGYSAKCMPAATLDLVRGPSELKKRDFLQKTLVHPCFRHLAVFPLVTWDTLLREENSNSWPDLPIWPPAHFCVLN